jgi:hypothetical protein
MNEDGSVGLDSTGGRSRLPYVTPVLHELSVQRTLTGAHNLQQEIYFAAPNADKLDQEGFS